MNPFPAMDIYDNFHGNKIQQIFLSNFFPDFPALQNPDRRALGMGSGACHMPATCLPCACYLPAMRLPGGAHPHTTSMQMLPGQNI